MADSRECQVVRGGRRRRGMAKVGVRIRDNDRYQTGMYKFVHQASMGGTLVHVLAKSALLVNAVFTAKVT